MLVQKGEQLKMKRNFLLVLVLVMVFWVFTGCEAAPSLPETLRTVKGYNDELFALVASHLGDTAPESFAEDTSITIGQGITCIVSSSSTNELNLIMTLDDWEASDGTEVSGTVVLDIEYYTSGMVYISIIRSTPAFLYFDLTSVSYVAESIDDDSSTAAFSSGSDMFFCGSLIVDGEILILNLIGW
jgi:hypothetical protein